MQTSTHHRDNDNALPRVHLGCIALHLDTGRPTEDIVIACRLPPRLLSECHLSRGWCLLLISRCTHRFGVQQKPKDPATARSNDGAEGFAGPIFGIFIFSWWVQWGSHCRDARSISFVLISLDSDRRDCLLRVRCSSKRLISRLAQIALCSAWICTRHDTTRYDTTTCWR